MRSDIAKLEMGQHIVVGTPGRVHDMIQRKALGMCALVYCASSMTRSFRLLFLDPPPPSPPSSPLSCTHANSYSHAHAQPHTPTPTHLDTRHIKMFVLDEADEMLSRGFKDQIYDVFRKLPSTIQVRSSPLCTHTHAHTHTRTHTLRAYDNSLSQDKIRSILSNVRTK